MPSRKRRCSFPLLRPAATAAAICLVALASAACFSSASAFAFNPAGAVAASPPRPVLPFALPWSPAAASHPAVLHHAARRQLSKEARRRRRTPPLLAKGNDDDFDFDDDGDIGADLGEFADDFDGAGFAGYLAPYALALLVSVGVTAAFVKYVLLDY